jgi:hypothetical protein
MKLDDLIRQVQGDDPLDRLSSAMGVKGDLDELTDSLIGHFVDQARRAGCSWSEIGAAMGVSKQAAQQRHTGERPHKRGRGGSGRLPMFARFTPRARTAVREAQAGATELRHGYVGTEHLLLGLVAVPESIAGKSLAALGITRASIVDRLERGNAERSAERAHRRRVPFTPLAQRVLEQSVKEALTLGHSYVGTEHLLLALTTESEGLAAKILEGAGADHASVLRDVVERLKQVS